MGGKLYIQLTIAMCSCNVSFQGSPCFTLLTANRTNLKAVKMGLNVVFHFSFVLVDSLTNLTTIHNPLPMFTN